MFTIKKMNAISSAVYDYLGEDKFTINEDAADYDAILVGRASARGW